MAKKEAGAPEGASEIPKEGAQDAVADSPEVVSQDAVADGPEVVSQDAVADGPEVVSQGSVWVRIMEPVKHDGELLKIGDEVELSLDDAHVLCNCGAAKFLRAGSQ